MKLEEFLVLDLEKDERLKKLSIEELSIVQNLLHGFKSPGRCLDEPCKKCGKKEVYCNFIDADSADHSYNWWHLCLNCLDVKHQSVRSCSGYEQEGDEDCPFCNYRWVTWPK